MKSVCASGKIEKLLLAFHQAHARKSAGADGDQRLQQLKSGALRIGIGIEKGHEPRLPVGNVRDQEVEDGQRAAAPAAIHFQESPATKRIAVAISTMSTEVPRSGCRRMSTMQTRIGPAAGRIVCRKSSLRNSIAAALRRFKSRNHAR